MLHNFQFIDYMIEDKKEEKIVFFLHSNQIFNYRERITWHAVVAA